MWQKRQRQHYTWGLVLAVLLLAGLVLKGAIGSSPVEEQKGLELLRALLTQRVQPSEAEWQRIESEFPRTRAAGLARFGRGYARYTAGDFAAAVNLFSDPVIDKKTALGDHALFLLAKSWWSLKRLKEAEQALARLVDTYPDSIWLREASLTAAQLAADRQDYKRAISHLRRLAERREPDALLQIAQLYQQMKDRQRALELYQEIYFDLPPSREALEAEEQLQAAGLIAKGSTTIPYVRFRGRFEKLYHAGAYADAVHVYENFLVGYPEAAEDEKLILQYGRSLAELSSLRQAIVVLKNLKAKSAEIRSEALYALAESYLRRGQSALFVDTSRALVQQFPRSPWAAATLWSRAMYYLRAGRDDLAVSTLKELVRLHPHSAYAPEASYRIGLKAYLAGRYREASQYLLDHVRRYVNSEYYGASLYWAGRAAEREGRPERALAIFERLLQRYRYTYYGQMAQTRLEHLRSVHKNLLPVSPDSDPILHQALAKVRSVEPPEESLSEGASAHLNRAHELRLIRVEDLALKELEEAQAQAPRSPMVSLELARLYRDQGNHRAAIAALQQAHPEYTLYQGGEVPREVEELLFPLAYWETIRAESQRHELDPYWVAGLIRQESAFDPQARSRANARGLMQLIPSTGRLVARHHGLRHLSPTQLYEPELNIRLGTSFLANLVKQFGRIEYATAAYNGGPARVRRWQRTLPHQEIDEWIESIPISETRVYVQAVIRNAAHYRRLYRQPRESTS